METSILVLISPRKGLYGSERRVDLSPGTEPLRVLKGFDELHDVDAKLGGKTAWPILTDGCSQFRRTATEINGFGIADKLSAGPADERQSFVIAPLSDAETSADRLRHLVQPGLNAADSPTRRHRLEVCWTSIVAEVWHT
jgi:hypothetical protein